MTSKRKQRFESKQWPSVGGNYAVWDSLKDKWYEPMGTPLLDWSKAKSEERCINLQRQFEWANSLPFLDESMSGPDFMDDEYYLHH